MFTWKFWKDSLERMVFAFANTMIALVGADGMQILNSDIGDKLLVSLSAAAVSLLKSLIGSKVGDSTDPSFLK